MGSPAIRPRIPFVYVRPFEFVDIEAEVARLTTEQKSALQHLLERYNPSLLFSWGFGYSVVIYFICLSGSTWLASWLAARIDTRPMFRLRRSGKRKRQEHQVGALDLPMASAGEEGPAPCLPWTPFSGPALAAALHS